MVSLSWWFVGVVAAVCAALLSSATARAIATNVGVSAGVALWYLQRVATRPRVLVDAAARYDRNVASSRLAMDLGRANRRLSSAVIAGGLAYVHPGWVGDASEAQTAWETASNRSIASTTSSVRGD
jgi:hypothetical protein